MQNPEEIVLNNLADKKQLEESNEVIQKVDKIIGYIKSKGWEEHMKEGNLGRLAWNLSTIMFNLGEMVAEYTLYANASYIYRKFKYYQEFKKIRQETDSTITESKQEAEQEVENYFEKQMNARYLADLLKTKYDECNRMVMVIQSIMAKEKAERMRSGGVESTSK
jgi:hypothetical protein